MKYNLAGVLGMLFLAGITCTADAAKLAEIQADLRGTGTEETVTLYGDTLAGGSNYYHNLMLMVTDEDGKLITAYTPSLKGGYNLLLNKAPAGKGSKKETVILTAPQGTAGESVAYRVLDFGKSDKVKETFTDVDSLGITTNTAYLSGNRFKVSCDINGSLRLLEGDVNGSDKLHVFDADGNVQKQYLRPMVTGLLSLIPLDGKLYSSQNIVDADGTTVLGVLYTTWEWEKETWTPKDVQLENSDTHEENKLTRAKINANASAGKWHLYSKSYVQKGIETTYAEVAIEGEPELQNKINETIQTWVHSDKDSEQQAYRLEFAGPSLLSFVAFKEDANNIVTEKMFNFNMKTGETVSVKEMFNYKDKDFLPILNLLGRPKNSVTSLPIAWYYNGGTFVFILNEADLAHVHITGTDNLAPAKITKNKTVAKTTTVVPKAVTAKTHKKAVVPKAWIAPDGSFIKGQHKEVGVGAGYMVKFVTDKKLPLSR
jgi:hypothetical protein